MVSGPPSYTGPERSSSSEDVKPNRRDQKYRESDGSDKKAKINTKEVKYDSSKNWAKKTSHEDSFGVSDESSTARNSSGGDRTKKHKKKKLTIIRTVNKFYRRALYYCTHFLETQSQVLESSVAL